MAALLNLMFISNVSLITSDALLIAHAYTISNVVDENGGVIGNHQDVNTFLRSHISAMSLPEDDFHVEELRSLLEHALQNTYKSRENDPKVTDAPHSRKSESLRLDSRSLDLVTILVVAKDLIP